jgi:hypothetical protein
MFSTPHALFDSAWPFSVATVLGVLFLLRLCVWRSPWSLVPWLGLAGATALLTLGLFIVSLLVILTPSSPGVFHPLAFAGPLFVALILGIVATGVLWFTRPPAESLKKKHWTAAILAIPVTVALILFSPYFYSRDLVIHCKVTDGTASTEFELQRMQVNEVIKHGVPVRSTGGTFHLRLNTHESYTAFIRAEGLEDRKIGIFPNRDKGFWIFFGDGEPQRLPLSKPVELTLLFEERKTPNDKGCSEGEERALRLHPSVEHCPAAFTAIHSRSAHCKACEAGSPR